MKNHLITIKISPNSYDEIKNFKREFGATIRWTVEKCLVIGLPILRGEESDDNSVDSDKKPAVVTTGQIISKGK